MIINSIYSSSIWKKLSKTDNKSRNFRIMLIGIIIYLIIHSFIYSKYTDNNKVITNYRHYMYYIIGFDLLLFYIIAMNQSNKKKKKKKKRFNKKIQKKFFIPNPMQIKPIQNIPNLDIISNDIPTYKPTDNINININKNDDDDIPIYDNMTTIPIYNNMTAIQL